MLWVSSNKMSGIKSKVVNKYLQCDRWTDKKLHLFCIHFLKHQTNQQNVFRYAREVVTGDDVLVQKNVELIPAKVVTVSSFIMQGICLSIINFLFYPVKLKLLHMVKHFYSCR